MSLTNDFADTAIRTSLNLACTGDPHTAFTSPHVLSLGLELHGPNTLAQDLAAQLLEVVNVTEVLCRSCQQTVLEQEQSSPRLPHAAESSATRPLDIDERLSQTRQAIAAIAQLWNLDPYDVDVAIRHTPIDLYTGVFHHPEAQPELLASQRSYKESWTQVRVRTSADGNARSLTFQILGDHAPSTKQAFGDHWPQAFVPHKIVPQFDNVRLCDGCNEKIIEHRDVETDSKEPLQVWDPAQVGRYDSPGEQEASPASTEPVDHPNFGDEGHDSGSPDAEQHAFGRAQAETRVPYANSFADTASSATSN